MISIDYEQKIILKQGDSGMLCLGSNPYEFQGGDKVIFNVSRNGNIVLSKSSSLVDRGLIFIELTDKDTKSLPIGVFSYSVFAEYENGSLSEFIFRNREIEVIGGD